MFLFAHTLLLPLVSPEIIQQHYRLLICSVHFALGGDDFDATLEFKYSESILTGIIIVVILVTVCVILHFAS